MHNCAIPQCHKLIEEALLMCPRHWRQVPRELQNKVWRTWKPIKEVLDGKVLRDYPDKLHSYEEAKRQAVEAVVSITSNY